MQTFFFHKFHKTNCLTTTDNQLTLFFSTQALHHFLRLCTWSKPPSWCHNYKSLVVYKHSLLLLLLVQTNSQSTMRNKLGGLQSFILFIPPLFRSFVFCFFFLLPSDCLESRRSGLGSLKLLLLRMVSTSLQNESRHSLSGFSGWGHWSEVACSWGFAQGSTLISVGLVSLPETTRNNNNK